MNKKCVFLCCYFLSVLYRNQTDVTSCKTVSSISTVYYVNEFISIQLVLSILVHSKVLQQHSAVTGSEVQLVFNCLSPIKMSSDISVKPDFSKKVRYNRKVQEDNMEWEERTVAIYESAYNIRNDHTDLQSHNGAVQSRPFRAAAFCLGVLCFLTITGIILLYILYISVTLEKDQLQGQILDMAVNHSQLQSSYETLSKNHSQLQDEVKQLKKESEGKWCPKGWERFGCSCYRKFNGEKTWSDSRWDCYTRGAHLVIINNEEEQKYVTELNKDGDSWIGLRATERSQTGWKWKWVDDSPLTVQFWATGLPQQPGDQYAAVCCDKQGKWTESNQNDNKSWICEKDIS
ncbi:CD209 antigen-like protein E isoform X2 [Micropterus dolomieu]|uniref:CD209 antigen-like protein E isoform X2 n=1 Tax=Micropterus dolomieu TaxID=147949 RepID=UPI001E8E11A1|nr:CD209 antigen-like protein E isoform X2 [Micropterus dolomieu]